MAPKPSSRALLLLTVLAAPVALAFETLLRALLFPEDFEVLREFLRPFLTPVAWALGLLAGGASFAGLVFMRRMAERRLARLPADAEAEQRYAQVLGVFMLTTAIPQIPAVLSTFAFMFGASLAPVLVGIVLATVGVIGQALRISSLAKRR